MNRDIKRNDKGQFVKGTFRPDMENDHNPNWKGERASYFSKHDWIRLRLRDRSDWLRLCTSCHHKHDDSRKKMWKTRRAVHA